MSWNRGRAVRLSVLFIAVLLILSPVDGSAQRERQAAADQSEQKFFDQLRSLFGRFRDEDLRRSFESALPVQCNELTSDTGEWRPVAFFNEDRKLGEWYYRSLAEVKSELSVFTFKGECSKDDSSVQ